MSLCPLGLSHVHTNQLVALCDSIKADHGYNMDSKSVRHLLQVMSELTNPERREFLQFVTGSPKLPIGGEFARFPLFPGPASCVGSSAD